MRRARCPRWRSGACSKGQRLPDAHAGLDGWTARDKFSALPETAGMSETASRSFAADTGSTGKCCRLAPGVRAGQ